MLLFPLTNLHMRVGHAQPAYCECVPVHLQEAQRQVKLPPPISPPCHSLPTHPVPFSLSLRTPPGIRLATVVSFCRYAPTKLLLVGTQSFLYGLRKGIRTEMKINEKQKKKQTKKDCEREKGRPLSPQNKWPTKGKNGRRRKKKKNKNKKKKKVEWEEGKGPFIPQKGCWLLFVFKFFFYLQKQKIEESERES